MSTLKRQGNCVIKDLRIHNYGLKKGFVDQKILLSPGIFDAATLESIDFILFMNAFVTGQG